MIYISKVTSLSFLTLYIMDDARQDTSRAVSHRVCCFLVVFECCVFCCTSGVVTLSASILALGASLRSRSVRVEPDFPIYITILILGMLAWFGVVGRCVFWRRFAGRNPIQFSRFVGGTLGGSLLWALATAVLVASQPRCSSHSTDAEVRFCDLQVGLRNVMCS